MDVMQIRRALMMMVTGGEDMGAWKQKTVTIQSAISLGGGFATLIQNNIPSGTEFVIIANDNLDKTQYINNQLVYGLYHANDDNANSWMRYRNNDYMSSYGAGLWSNTYALTASQGDTYTLFYK